MEGLPHCDPAPRVRGECCILFNVQLDVHATIVRTWIEMIVSTSRWGCFLVFVGIGWYRYILTYM